MNHLTIQSVESTLEEIDREYRHTVALIKADSEDTDSVKLLSLLHTAQSVFFKLKKELLK
jgi:hypothetical protein